MKHVHVPTVRDVNRLHELSSRHRKTYATQYADVRNLHVAHTGAIDANTRVAMFQKTRIRDFEKLVVFLNRLYEALWHMYYNGRRPILRPMAYSTRSLVAKRLEDLSRYKTQEYIIAETRKCLALFTEAAVRSKARASTR